MKKGNLYSKINLYNYHHTQKIKILRHMRFLAESVFKITRKRQDYDEQRPLIMEDATGVEHAWIPNYVLR